MTLFKINFVFAFSILFSFALQAEEPIVKTGHTPPFVINVGDTSSLIYSELNSIAHELTAEKIEIVQDTALPPCDIVFYKSGKLEYCKIIETTPTTVSYKMCDYLDGPTIIANKSTIHKIRYANGREEVVTVEQQATINAYVKARKDPMSTWALICSLGGLILFPGAIAGIILGFFSLRRIKKSNGALRGKGSAKAAIIIGGILLLLYALTL